MISVEELDRAILEHEAKDTTYANCERLAWLYIVRDHVSGYQPRQPVPVDADGESDFIKAVHGRDSVKVWAVLDELMETLAVVNPRLYAAVVRKIEAVE